MCRFVVYLGEEITLSSLVTEPANSIIHQSFHSHEREEPLNGDGFGVAWYRPEITSAPVVFKDITPAWNNQNLLNLAPVIQSSCVLAHVRAATPGLPVIQLNCHPFSCGPFAFMHNGTVAGFPLLRRRILERLSDEAFQRIVGSTDSEYVFALFIDQFNRTKNGKERSAAMAAALTATIAEIDEIALQAGIQEPSFLNCAVTDGQSAVVSRYVTKDPEKAHSLYYHTGSRYVCADGICQMIRNSGEATAVMIASEPLSQDPGWTWVRGNSMVVVDENRGVEVRDL